MSRNNSDSGKELGFSFRRLARILFLLIASRVAYAGVSEYISNGNWLAGILGITLASIIAYWLFRLYIGSNDDE